jgi:hypothetical protein
VPFTWVGVDSSFPVTGCGDLQYELQLLRYRPLSPIDFSTDSRQINGTPF